MSPYRQLTPGFLLICAVICAVATIATPYAVLKLGMSVDMSIMGMMIVAATMARSTKSRQDQAITLNITQTMVNVVQGIGFMVVILGAFYWIQKMTGRDELALNLPWWQIGIWLSFSASLGVFMGVLPRRLILDDTTLPWPSAQAVIGVTKALVDPDQSKTVREQRRALGFGTVFAGIVTFLRDGKGLISSITLNGLLNVSLSLDFIGIGFGMLLPLSVGLSGLIGVYLIYAYGEQVAILAALNGTTPEHWSACLTAVHNNEVNDFVTSSCGHAEKYIAIATKGGNAFQYVVQWMMWPATAMMVTSAVTGVGIPLLRNAFTRRDQNQPKMKSLADEHVSTWWIIAGIVVNTIALVIVQGRWLNMPWHYVVISVAFVPLLQVTGLRILGITGQGPVSLIGNAMQFAFAIFRPGELKNNLVMAHLAADGQASAEATAASFWVARRIGGSFKALILAQMIIIPIGAFLTPFAFGMMMQTYGIGYDAGQLSAPTSLKIASLAVAMEKGASGLPQGALNASIAAALIGVFLEVLMAFRRKDKDGNEVMRFPWVPVPSMIGFAMILPPSLTIATAAGSVVSAIWRASSKKNGSYATYRLPLASGFLAGESIIGGVFLPALFAAGLL